MVERAAVTGATGFIGTALCRRLRAHGWEVVALRRERSDVSGLADLDVEWVVGDVLEAASVREVVEGSDVVFHLAGVGLLSADPATVRRVNVEGTRNVVDAALPAGSRVVLAGTAGTRRRAGVADEDDLARPVGAYQASKAAAEAVVADGVSRGLDAVVALPTSVFGPGDEQFTARLVSLATDPKLVAYLPGGVSVVSVHDVARGLLAAAERGRCGEAYLLGGENRTYGELLSTIARVADGHPPRVRIPPAMVHLAGAAVGVVNGLLGTRLFPVDRDMSRLVTRELYYSSEKARRELGYTYDPFEAYVDEAVRWYRHREDGGRDERAAVARGEGTATGGGAADASATRTAGPSSGERQPR